MASGPKRSAYGWSFAMSGGQAIINIASSLILAALIGPESYGVVAMGLVYVMLIQVLLRQGMGAALVQRESLSEENLRTVFVILAFLILVLTSTSVALSGWWSSVNNLPQLRGIILALSLLLPIRGLIVIPDALLRREMRFKALAARANLGALAGGAAGIALAISGAGVWALVAQQLVGAILELVVLIKVSGWRPGFGFDTKFAREMLSFSSGTFLASLGGFVVLRADAILMGLFFGPLAVGLFRFAIRLVDTLVGAVTTALQNVALPILSSYRNDSERFARELGRLYIAAALVAWPALGVIAGSAQGLIGLLGDEWNDAVVPIRLLSVAGAGSALSFTTSAVMTSLGYPHRYAAIAWMSGLLNLGALVGVGVLMRNEPVSNQIIGVAIANIILHAGINLAIYVWASLRMTTLDFGDILPGLVPPLVAAIAAASAGSFIGGVTFLSSADRLMYVATTAAVSASAAAIVLMLLTPGGLRGVVLTIWPTTDAASET